MEYQSDKQRKLMEAAAQAKRFTNKGDTPQKVAKNNKGKNK